MPTHYGVEQENWADHHPIIDGTAIDLDTVVSIVVHATMSLRQQKASPVQP